MPDAPPPPGEDAPPDLSGLVEMPRRPSPLAEETPRRPSLPSPALAGSLGKVTS